MKKSKFSETQIVSILREVEAGAKVAETCRKYGISDACYYQWKSKYAGMDVPPFRMLLQKSFSPGEEAGIGGAHA